MIGKVICWLARYWKLNPSAHKWRRPHNGEPADTRICRRCGAGRPVRKRKAKA